MKALTLIQPWATLIALGEKKIETRSWKTSYRGPLLIHAGKKIDRDTFNNDPFYSVLYPYGYSVYNKLPTGVIIAKCNLVHCFPIEYDDYTNEYALLADKQYVEGNEYHFGDYTSGRYAWILENIELLKEPIPAKGQLSLWEFDFKEER